jgi:hypothetical protein
MFEPASALAALRVAGTDVDGGLQADNVALNATSLHATVDTSDSRGVAVQQQMMELLLQHGAEVDARNCSDQTP